jgi:hypothetical protein
MGTLQSVQDRFVVAPHVVEGTIMRPKVGAFASVQTHGDFHSLLSIAASLTVMALALVASSRQFATADY